MIILLMAGKTIGRGAFKDIIDMALFAQDSTMRSAQLKSCQGMIKCGWFPGFR